MPEKDPATYSLITYMWMSALAGMGGFVSYYQKVKTGLVSRWSFTELIGELFTSAFCGVITFWLCEAGNFEPLITAAFVGIAGHMGSRGLFAIENIMVKRFG